MKKELEDKIDIMIPVFIAEKKKQFQQMEGYESGTKWGEYIQALFDENVKLLTKEKAKREIFFRAGWLTDEEKAKKREEERIRNQLEEERICKENEILSNYPLGTEISHKIYGTGEIIEISGKYITVRFQDSEKTMRFDAVYCIEKGIIEK